MTEENRLLPKNTTILLVTVMKALVGNACISLEGNLSHCKFFGIKGASYLETAILKRNTIEPKQDFIILPLEQETLWQILHEILQAGRLTRDIIHIQIEKDRGIEFAAYDNFHPDCIVIGHMLKKLIRREVDRSGPEEINSGDTLLNSDKERKEGRGESEQEPKGKEDGGKKDGAK